MEGPEVLTARVAGWLNEEVPRALTRQRDRLHVEARTLPPPVKVYGHDINQLGLEQWPAIIATPAQLLRMDVVDAATDSYWCVYEVKVYAWVRAEGYDAVARQRSRYALAIREALLTRKSLAASVGPRPAEGSVNPATIREDYGPPVDTGRGQTIAGVETTLEVTVLETLDQGARNDDGATGPRLATATVEVDELLPHAITGDPPPPARFPDHPALM